MVKGKKIAKIFRTSKALLIKREGEDFWVSDTYLLLRLSGREANNFLSKYNGYRTTEDIPPLKPGQTYKKDSEKSRIIEEDPIGVIISDYEGKDLITASLSNFCYKYKNRDCRMYRFGRQVGLFADRYSFVIDDIDSVTLACDGVNEPLVVKSEGKIVGLVMPVRQSDDLVSDIRSLAKAAS